MSISGAGYSGPSKIHYLFVDGGSLRGKLDNIFRMFFNTETYAIDFGSLAHGYTKTFYYDAVPVKLDSEDEVTYRTRVAPQVEMLDAASNVDRIHVYEGDVRRRRRRNEQKKVDVMIAVDMLTHTFRRNMHEATLLTGDNDFKPLIDALVHDGMLVNLWYPADETSKELLRAADVRRPLNMQGLRALLSAQSRSIFSVPTAEHLHPSVEPGHTVREWYVDGIRHALNKEGADFIVLRDFNEHNRLHIRHRQFDLLNYFCKESYEIEIPQA